jgi:beta-N-acetylhexosaminidase
LRNRFNWNRSVHWPGFTAVIVFLIFAAGSAWAESVDQLRTLLGQRLLICVDWPRLSPEQHELLQKGWVGGVILFEQDVKSPQQLLDYVESLRALSPQPLLVAVDQEGGEVRRLREEQGFQTIPSESFIGQSKDPKAASLFGVQLGLQLKAESINLDFAPVVDLDTQAQTPIINDFKRSLGSDPVKVADLADQIVRGMKAEGVLAAAKHFPGETAANANPHEGEALSNVSLDELEKNDLVPYRKLIADGLDAVMTSHVTYAQIDPGFPASLSRKIIQDILRKELGFKGLVICDDLRMGAIENKFPLPEAVVQAVNAGVDLLIATGDTGQFMLDTLVQAAQDGKISLAEARESYDRIQRIKSKYVMH